MVKTFNEILRDFSTDGVPSSGPHQPIKADFREALTAVEAFSNASGSALIYQTRALLFADLAHAANTMAWVVNDATTAYNGVYEKSGASGAGSWTRVADLPYSFIVATNSGAGTANAIQATTAIPVTSSALILLPIVATASSAPITVSFNGDPALTIKTTSAVDAVSLPSGYWALGLATGTDFRLFSDEAVASLIYTARDEAVAANAAAQTARTGAEEAQALAEVAAASVSAINYFDFYVDPSGGTVDSVTISGGYTPGTVLHVYMNGILVDGWSATNGTTVTGLAITVADLVDGDTTVWVRVGIGDAVAGTDILDGRYLNRNSDGVSVTGTTWTFDNRPIYASSQFATLDDIAAATTGVASFNTRTGAVVPTAGDYSAAMVTVADATLGEDVEAALATLKASTGAALFYPETYGVSVGTGGDDTAAFQAMLSAIATNNGGTVILTKHYNIDTADLVITKPITMIGIFSNGSATNGSSIRFAAGTKLIFRSVSGGTYIGVNFVKKAAGANLIYFDQAQATGCSYINFMSCNFSGEATSSLVYMTNVLKIGFSQCRFVNSYTAGGTKVVYLDGGEYGGGGARTLDNVDNVEFLQCIIAGTSGGDQDLVSLNGKADSMKFHQCALIFGSNGIRTYVSGTTTQEPNFLYFSGGGFENGSGNSVRLERGDRIFFSTFYASHASSGTGVDVIYTDTTFAGNAEFSGGYVRGGRRHGYRLDGGQISIIGGSSGNNGTVTSGSSGIFISTSAAMVRCVGVKCGPYPNGSSAGQIYGINNGNGAAQSIIVGCDLTGNSSAGITGTTTGTAIGLNLV